MDGYKFSNGDIRHLTRPQIQFIHHAFKFKMELKYGKGKKAGKKGKGMGPAGLQGGYTPEQLNAKMAPKFEKMDKEARDSEIEAGQKVMAFWEKKQLEKMAQMRQSSPTRPPKVARK